MSLSNDEAIMLSASAITAALNGDLGIVAETLLRDPLGQAYSEDDASLLLLIHNNIICQCIEMLAKAHGVDSAEMWRRSLIDHALGGSD